MRRMNSIGRFVVAVTVALGLGDTELTTIRLGAYLHDLGKVKELRFDGKGAGQGTFSLATGITVDAATHTLGLEPSPPAQRLLKNVKREPG